MLQLTERMRRQLIQDLDRLQSLILLAAAGDRSMVRERDLLELALEERLAHWRDRSHRRCDRPWGRAGRKAASDRTIQRTVKRSSETTP